MAKMNFDEEGLLEEPCISCKKAYVDNLFFEWCCDEKECPYKAENKIEQGLAYADQDTMMPAT